MKKYRVYVYNNEEKFHDCYEVQRERLEHPECACFGRY